MNENAFGTGSNVLRFRPSDIPGIPSGQGQDGRPIMLKINQDNAIVSARNLKLVVVGVDSFHISILRPNDLMQ
jgi:hypothetical protein